MRILFPSLLGVLALSGCEVPDAPQAGGCPYYAGRQGQAYGGTETDMGAEVACMQREWTESKRQVSEARAETMASGRSIPPEVDAEVTELLNRDVEGPNDEVRLRRLSDAVSDARRLAELLRAG
jgi:hypothetical protein